jgi:hypothetical protein
MAFQTKRADNPEYPAEVTHRRRGRQAPTCELLGVLDEIDEHAAMRISRLLSDVGPFPNLIQRLQRRLIGCRDLPRVIFTLDSAEAAAVGLPSWLPMLSSSRDPAVLILVTEALTVQRWRLMTSFCEESCGNFVGFAGADGAGFVGTHSAIVLPEGTGLLEVDLEIAEVRSSCCEFGRQEGRGRGDLAVIFPSNGMKNVETAWSTVSNLQLQSWICPFIFFV